jgi:hypothetical protein
MLTPKNALQLCILGTPPHPLLMKNTVDYEQKVSISFFRPSEAQKIVEGLSDLYRETVVAVHQPVGKSKVGTQSPRKSGA